MRKRLGIGVVVVALAASLVAAGLATAAGGERPVNVRVGNLALTFNGGFSPQKLPKRKLAPIALKISGKIRTVDGSQPPPLKEIILDTDRNGAINVKGYPTCRSGQLQARDTKAVERVCKRAIIGKGQTTVSVAFPEQPRIPAHSKLLVLNGGVKRGVTTLYIHAYLTQPITTAIVTTVKIKKEHKGHFGLHSVAKVPLIANGAGSVTSFNLKISKRFTYRHKRRSVLSARCSNGRLRAHGTAVFRDSTRVSAEVIRRCVPRR